MTQVQQAIDTFERAVGTMPELWSSLDVRCLAIRMSDEWHNLAMRSRLDHRTPENVPRVSGLPVTAQVACYQAVLPSTSLSKLLQELQQGEAAIGDIQIKFQSFETSGLSPYGRGSAWAATRQSWKRDYERYPTAHRLVLYSGGDGLLRRAKLDREEVVTLLSTLEEPWDGLEAVLKYALRSTTDIDASGSQSVEIVAPLEAQLEHCELRDGALSYAITAGSQSVADRCMLGLFGEQSEGQVISQSICAADSWQRDLDSGDRRLAASLTLEGVQQVSLLLRVGPFLIDRRIVTDLSNVGENTRVLSYEQFDPGLKRLAEIVEDPSKAKNEDEFHSIVARLFTFAGFSVDSFVADASLSGKGIPDLLAYAPHEQTTLVVECTTGVFASPRDKMSLLVGRARRVRKAIAPDPGHVVMPVIITALADVAPHEIEAARRSRIVVLTRKELAELLRFAQERQPLREVIRWFEAHIPAKEPPGPLLMPGGRVR